MATNDASATTPIPGLRPPDKLSLGSNNLRRKIKSCNFCEQCRDSILRGKIILGIRSAETQTDLLKVRTLDLQKSIDICRAAENAESQNKMMRTGNIEDSTVNKISHKRDMSTKRNCRYCGGNHTFANKEKCPAYGKTCSKCKKQNHFARVCKAGGYDKPRQSHGSQSHPKKKMVRTVHEESENGSDNNWIYTLKNDDDQDAITKEVKCRMKAGQQDVIFLIDTGATVNILPQHLVKREDIRPTIKRLTQYNGETLKTARVVRTDLYNPKMKREYETEFVVLKGDYQPVLGAKTAVELGLIDINTNKFDRVSLVTKKGENLVREFHVVFSEDKIGTLPGVQHLKTDEQVLPVIQPSRRIPISIRSRLKAELQKMEKQGVIAKVDKPTPWVNQVVICPKKEW
ncbi:hypothetical protein RRG08_036917 [Elysia crispata]|uniref:Uncharacterized protein n=1 Tax=Elysia crispata TaxID=231223 RepID=A0AAE0ZI62_9GAST|nr:hypothetical protein RRG08_036917 [Elysia crispata]